MERHFAGLMEDGDGGWLASEDLDTSETGILRCYGQPFTDSYCDCDIKYGS